MFYINFHETQFVSDKMLDFETQNVKKQKSSATRKEISIFRFGTQPASSLRGPFCETISPLSEAAQIGFIAACRQNTIIVIVN